MADHHFGRAESWEELVAEHDRWLEDYNAQRHWAHQEDREDAPHSRPQAVLGFYTSLLLRYREEDLQRAFFFSTRFSRVLEGLGYARFRDWRLSTARKGSQSGRLRSGCNQGASSWSTVARRSQPTTSSRSRRAARLLWQVANPVDGPRVFETSYTLAQLRLFTMDDAGWLKMMKLQEYAPRQPRGSMALQEEVLFPYLEPSSSPAAALSMGRAVWVLR
jgi:hypothetical protein